MDGEGMVVTGAQDRVPEEQKQRLRDVVAERDVAAIRRELAALYAPQVADVLPEFPPPQRVILFRALPRSEAAEVFAYLETDEQERLLHALSDSETRHVLENMPPDDRTALLAELPGEVTRQLVQLLPAPERKEASRLLGYPEESVGRIMTPDFVDVREEWTIREALAHIRRIGHDSETISRIFVTDADGVLIDDIRLRKFILADPDDGVVDVMDHQYVALSAFDDREEAVRLMRRYDAYALPVVDSDGVLLGIVTADDVLDVAVEEATEDIHKAASVAPLKMSYARATPTFLYRRRVGWLSVLVLVNLVSAGIITQFEETLATVAVLAAFIPLLIGSGGNTGSQSATLMIRAIATGDVTLRYWGRAFGKELLVGGLLGVSLGLLASLLGGFYGDATIAMIVGFTMIAIVVVANLLGMSLPFILPRVGIDPAVASAPLVTTLVDAVGLIIYFTIATMLLAGV